MNLLLVPALLPVALMLAVLALEKFEHWALRAVPKVSDRLEPEPAPSVPEVPIGTGESPTPRPDPHVRPLPRPRPRRPERVRSSAPERAR